MTMMQSMWPPMKRHTFNALLTLLTLILRDRFAMVFASTVQPPIVDTSALFTPFDRLHSGEVHANGNVARTIDVAANDFYQFNDIDPSQLFADTVDPFGPSNFVSSGTLFFFSFSEGGLRRREREGVIHISSRGSCIMWVIHVAALRIMLQPSSSWSYWFVSIILGRLRETR